ncbi:fasciclin domain-containing protein, partial [Cyclobacteriaceae bacterium]|nr:fasciclin domain-containing protein [Cyclobacteriaceae bacterium]
MDTNSNSQLIKKIMKKLTIIFTIILSVFSKNVMAQGEHPSNKQSEHPSNKTASNTIVDVAVSNKDFSTLVAALKAADLVSALQGAGPFTVFAPTNDAFAKIDAETLASLLEKKNQKVLANILTYHVISGKLAAADVVAALEKGKGSVVLTALNGEAITVMQKDG